MTRNQIRYYAIEYFKKHYPDYYSYYSGDIAAIIDAFIAGAYSQDVSRPKELTDEDKIEINNFLEKYNVFNEL